MDSHWSSQNVDPFLLQPNLQNGFQLDMNNLFDFDDALFQEQNCATPATYQAQSLTDSPYTSMSSMTQSNISPIAESDSPNSLPSTLGFESMTPPLISSNKNSPSDEWLLNPATGEVTLSTEGNDRDASKRTRGEVDDNINACWKSPLCPNRKDDLSRPDSCRGECADFLFANPTELPDDKKILSDILAKSEPRVVLETPVPTRQRKRSEMESTPETEGRTLPATSTSPVSVKADSQSSKPTSAKRSSSPAETRTSQASTTPPATSSQKPKGRVPHNQVEKKYRENVNAQLEALKRVVPVSKQQLVGFDGGLDIEDLAMSNARQPSKAVVLSSATAYIKQLEKENKRLQEELAAMRAQNSTLQSLVKCDDCSLMNYARQWKIRGPV